MKQERQINIFSVSFLDVFCCALGAMILLFILNSLMLNNTIKESVEKYRDKAAEAAREKEKAIQERNIAHQAREEAQQERNRALEARNQAELAELVAKESERIALQAQKDSEHQRQLAQQAETDAILAQKAKASALADVLLAQEEMKKAQSSMLQKNRELENINATLREMVQQNKNLDQVSKTLAEQNQSLQNTNKTLEQEKLEISQQLADIQKEKEQLRLMQEKYILQLKRLDEQNTQLTKDSKNTQTKNIELEKRLAAKEIDVQIWEQKIQEREKNLGARESDIREKEEKIAALEALLATKEDKSLFGVQLHYKRIVFLFDRSGSIKQNQWESVIIGTCKEILTHCEVDEFAIIAFSSDLKYFPARRGLCASGSPTEKQKAIQWLTTQIRFSGVTHLHEAIQVAYEDYGNLDAIFILTDGMPEMNRGIRASYLPPDVLQKKIISYVQNKVRDNIKTKIITIAIGYPPEIEKQKYSDIYKFLHKLSNMTNGQYLGR
ncbi:MAG: hypothetical protein KBC30_10000 [Planctomycetes bacterium]|nr:hypothetical protein [Planctomycetota bacterium]HNZ65795.1 hypothetical protein [Planctomycetota bacterium]HPY75669.1 hypothetical protein [Planctomycetota bacterium]HQB01218.1 hypothetical protein [Planctomycetota bacterium]